MPLILHIETSAAVCSVALSEHGQVVSMKETMEPFNHAESITLFVEHVFKMSGKKMSRLDAVAVSRGPGSYTGLRIGISTAKGLCYALEKPLIGLETLKVITQAFFKTQIPDSHSLFCPMVDARRMEVYCAVYDDKLFEIESVAAKIIDEHSFHQLLTNRKIYFFGDGAAKCKPWFVKNNNAIFVDHVFPSAVDMVAMAEQKFIRNEFEDTALFEPLYLKQLEPPK